MNINAMMNSEILKDMCLIYKKHKISSKTLVMSVCVDLKGGLLKKK